MTGVPDRRFGGLDRLFGVASAARIRNAHVAIVGLGGVGSWVAEALARSGVGQLTLIDFDQVAESNINRQIQAVRMSVGQAKVDAMRERIHSFFPECQVGCVEAFAEPDNWPGILPVGVNAVVDACDQARAKTAMAVWARKTGALHVMVGAAGGKRHAEKVAVADVLDVTHDPLLAKVRYQLRKEFAISGARKKLGVTCVYSPEAVAPPDASCGVGGDGSLNCHGFGSLVTVTASFGLCAAGVILNKLGS
ncbi:tRNA threonylcarbamoyladenosine dehydratase [Rhodoferax sp.]|uniref:tRNA threonylcarbamoyladenosine dehydratase n=1 Tax=Rhodoferax sp. TaxID=50421 RepID=UPI0008BCF315|nr:tRNA threonylcarbamoyladenosine dehydratase [Rhodoferax sp.]MDO8320091.1 tRNA threonylcarbamoyladenosine dehydratase [Rhodoferax sp.]MDP2680507.1 tRNA threonylcarbamoyladenosine dehydratase [Rhodoferax sp.]OGB57929.1 MAG: tRNA threonylcarbamoyladenosine dehydratase [Burkholderiales bacterium RIFOXYD12_FULL_59_19]OGB81971.1 MAG: tRNA threonylcarbamoyladenosine dehydratase [Burkholderiales bacterium RIFOXYC12_FULL_60_6]